MPRQPIDEVSDESEERADNLARTLLIQLGQWTIPDKPLPDFYSKAGRTMKKIIKRVKIPVDDPPKTTKIVKVVKVVRQIKPEQLSIDGRPWWCPNEPIWCITCHRSVILKINGECPGCHFLLAGPDPVPF